MGIEIEGPDGVQRMLATIRDDVAREIALVNETVIAVPLPHQNGEYDCRCPQQECLTVFKVDLATLQQKDTLLCVQCARRQHRDAYITPQQYAHARAVGLNILDDRISLGLPRQDAKYQPIESDNQTICAVCGCDFHVQGKLGFCPQCGVYNALQHALDDIARIAEDAKAGRQTTHHAYLLTVSAIKAYGCALEKPLAALGKKQYRFDFQNAEKTHRMLGELGIAINGQVYKDWLLGMCIRHLCEYQNGVVDEAFIQRTGHLTARVGRSYAFNTDEFLAFVCAMRSVMEETDRVVFAV